ncbi:MAG: preprotein translocase subunit SecD [Candidatus Nanoarchaeia archaeon]|nr:preprotein translocase subunit SecD [Candidatus Nanoarchaeia archaeon]MDD5587571.1 preprotein translocase subunit SecD [Candidatus Nanoarchaeia archaeon]
MKLGKLFKNWRMIVLILFLLFSYIVINPQFGEKGVVIKSVELNSTSYLAGMVSPSPSTVQTKLETIKSVNGNTITNLQEYSKALDTIKDGEIIRLTTDKREYAFMKTNYSGLTVANKPFSNIKKGLELAGGTRVLIQPEGKVTAQERDDLISTMENRLNVYGLSDIKLKPVNDLFGNNYILVEVAGASKEEVRQLIGQQGKFEAKLGNDTVFSGGQEDIKFVCRNDGTCSGIRECSTNQDGSEFCKFEFAIKLSEAAAKNFADITSKIPLITTPEGSEVLEKKLDFYLDDKQVDSLQVMGDLKGKIAMDISITGPGTGKDRNEAILDAEKQMKHLQTVLITGSLPTKLNIVKLDSISPLMGEQFLKNTLLVGILAIIAVDLIIVLRYRNIKVTSLIILISLAEIFIMLGVAAFLKNSLDMASIAGIIAAIGTGVNDQIIITDEGLRKEVYTNWKERIKSAFGIIFAAFAGIVAAMFPLLFAGAGLLRGFAIMTIIGISVGVFITRPAFAIMMENIMED